MANLSSANGGATRARFEARNIARVLEQIADDVDEIIPVDGNSTDATLITACSNRPDVRAKAVLNQSAANQRESISQGQVCRVYAWAWRIRRHMTPAGAVIVPPRIASWLEDRAGLTRDRRIRLRHTDPAAYEILIAQVGRPIFHQHNNFHLA